MSFIGKIFYPIIYVFRNHKKTIMISLFSASIFSFLLFPYDDLSDLLTGVIAKSTQNQIFLQFDELGISLFPPSLKMSNVSVDTPVFPTLKAKALRLAPSVASFLAFSPGFSATIEDFMKGDISVSYRAGKKVTDKIQMQKMSLDLSNIDLKKLSTFAGLPVDLEGRVNANVDAQVDLSFLEQPDGEIQFNIAKFRLPASTIPTMLGPASLPNTELSNITIKGKLKGAELTIDEGQIGAQGDTINGRFKGKINVRMNRQGGEIVPDWSTYDFKIDLNFDRAAEKNFGVFLSFYDKYKTITGSGSRYAFRLSAPNLQVPPSASPMGSF